MSMRQAFLDAIRESPDDDAPRLVYADWLTDNGDPQRAEFIRAQVRLARLPEDSEERWELEDRAADLYAQHGAEWAATLPEGVAVDEDEPAFVRGFVDAVECGAEAFAEHGETLEEPTQSVQFRFAEGRAAGSSLAQILASPALARFHHLDFRFQHLGPEHARLIADSPNVAHVRSLLLGSNGIGPRGLAALAASPNLGSLESLDLWFNGVGAEGAAALCASPLIERLNSLVLAGGSHPTLNDVRPLLDCQRLGNLHALTLSGNRLTAEGLARLCANRSLRGLERLDLHCNPIGPDGIEALASWDGLDELRWLWLGDTPLTPAGVRSLGNSIWLRQLRGLLLDTGHIGAEYDSSLGPDGARAIADCMGLPSLEELTLNGQGIGDEGAIALARWPGLATVRHLGLYENGIGDKGAAAFAASPYAAKLERLALARNEVGDYGAEAIAASPSFGRLRELKLSSNRIGGRGAQALASGRAFPWLRELDLGSCVMGDEGAQALAQSSSFPRLRELWLGECGIGPRRRSRLAGSPVAGRACEAAALPQSHRRPARGVPGAVRCRRARVIRERIPRRTLPAPRPEFRLRGMVRVVPALPCFPLLPQPLAEFRRGGLITDPRMVREWCVKTNLARGGTG